MAIDPAAEAKLAAEYLLALAANGVPRDEAVELTKYWTSANRISEAAKKPPEAWEQ